MKIKIFASLAAIFLTAVLLSAGARNGELRKKNSPEQGSNKADLPGPVAAVPESGGSPEVHETKRGNTTVRKLAGMIKEDRYCNGVKKVLDETSADRAGRQRISIYRALLLAEGRSRPNACAMAFLAKTREDAFFFSGKSPGTVCRLIRGLVLTEQWSSSLQGRFSTAEEKLEGIAILSALQKENSGNGFFALLLLGALPAQERELQGRAYQDFLQAERFENPLHILAGELRALGRLNPTAFMAGIEIFMTGGSPEYSVGMKAAIKMAKEGLFPADFAAWVERLKAEFARNDHLDLSEPRVSLLEDAIRKGIVINGRDMLGGIPSEFQHENWKKYYHRRVRLGDLTALVDFDAGCDGAMEQLRKVYPDLVREEERQASAR